MPALNQRMPHRSVAYALGYLAPLWMIGASPFARLAP